MTVAVVVMAANDGNARQQAWSAYWSSGRLHSCAGSFDGNYDGAIGRFWGDLATRLRPGARMLDLATGNGPLALLMWEMLEGRLEVDAVDMATVSPGWHQPALHGGIRFHSGIAMEALPFADGHFDLVASQFGFEYSDMPAALAECLRVAAPGATLAFVMHHAGSVLVAVGREEVAHHERLAGEDGLLAAAREVVPWIARMRAGEVPADAPAGARARESYNRAMHALAQAAAVAAVLDPLWEARGAVRRGVSAVGPGAGAAALDALDDYAAQLERARLRTAEMVGSALDQARLDALVGQLRKTCPGIAVECAELRQEEGVLAWSLVAGPAAAMYVDAG